MKALEGGCGPRVEKDEALDSSRRLLPWAGAAAAAGLS